MRKVTFFFAKGRGFSGQCFAAEILAEALGRRGWRVRVITTPILDRRAEVGMLGWIGHRLALMARLALAWFRGLRAAIGRGWLLVSPGQTRFALMRDGFPVLVRRVLRRQQPVMLSLHGSLFMGWNYLSAEARMLRTMAGTASHVTVLGPNQVARLAALGVPSEKALHVDNTCLLPAVTEAEILEKHGEGDRPLRILHLSNLLEAKGYAEFVEGLEDLATREAVRIEATLCGELVQRDDPHGRFATLREARDWITERMEQINRSERVRLRWVEGAAGKAKERLFRAADVFVLPTRYAVEAQPIVLLEALASGCVVVTTTIGEIATAVSDRTAVLLPEGSPGEIASALEALEDCKLRKSLALEGRRLFNERFSHAGHVERWEKLLLASGE